MKMPKPDTLNAICGTQIGKINDVCLVKKVLGINPKWIRCLLPLSLMLMSGLITAQDARIECPPSEIVACATDLMPSAPTLFTRDTVRTVVDNDMFYGTMDTENYADNPPLMIAGPGLSDGQLLVGVELRIFLKVENNSCEEDIDVRVTSPSGNMTEFTSPFPGCSDNDNTLYIFSEMLDASGVDEGNVNDWLIELRDTDDQNAMSAAPPSPFSPAGTEFSIRFAEINYFIDIPEQVSDFSSELTVNGQPDCPDTDYVYTYEVVAPNGDVLSCEQIFTIANNPPTITCGAYTVVDSAADIVLGITDVETSCGLEAPVEVADPVILGEPNAPGTTYTYTFTATDECGRQATCERTFKIQDTRIECAPDGFIDCEANLMPSAPTLFIRDTTRAVIDIDMFYGTMDTENYADNPPLMIAGPDISAGQLLLGAELKIFIKVENNSCEEDVDIRVTSPSGNVTEFVSPFSGCSDNDNTLYIFSEMLDVNGVNQGNIDDWLVELRDTDDQNAMSADPPSPFSPAGTEFSVRFAEINYFLDVPEPVADFNAELTVNGQPDCPGTTYTYNYEVVAPNGGLLYCEQTLTVDNDPPTVSCPAGGMVACAADIIPGTADFETSCELGGGVNRSGPVIVGEADCPGTTYTYIFVATDECGREATCEQVFTIQNDAPVITCAEDVTVSCAAEISVAIPTFESSCELEGEVSVEGPAVNGAPNCPGTTYTYTYIVEDACGRTASCEQVFIIANEEAPTVSCPANATVFCAADIETDISGVSFSASCGVDGTVSVSGPAIDGAPDCPGTTYTYTYIVEDECGRTGSCEQVFTIANVPPTISCPVGGVVACAADIVVDGSNVFFATSCEVEGSVSVSGPVITGEPDCPGTTYAYTYTVEDACGRTLSCDQVFTIANEVPTITCPADAAIACSADISVNASNATFITSCGTNADVSISGPIVNGESDCPGTTYTYTYTVEDACGRTASCDQVFTIENDEIPVISCPAGATVFCAIDIETDISSVSFSASCGVDGEVSVSDPVIDGEPDCPGTTYTYTYTVTDECGREASCEQVFTINNDPPVLTCSEEVMVSCASEISVTIPSFEASCGLGGSVSVSDPVINGTPNCEGTTYTYTFTGMDDCGRMATCEQVFIIANTEPPTIECPSDATVFCAGDILVSTEDIVFTTGCEVDGTVSISDPVINGEPDCPGTTYTYTYIIEDACGGTSSCEQVFTIANVPPTISCPIGATVACAADIVVDASNVFFATSCEIEGMVSISDPVIDGEPDCSGTTYTYTYTVEDACGRTLSCDQVFTIENEAPTITCPASATVACAADISVDASNAVFTTSCDLDANVDLSGPAINGEPDCPGTTYTYTYTMEDACGRIASCDQVFTIENDAPTITCPADAIVACSADILVDASDAVFTVSCDLGTNISVDGPAVNGVEDCPGTTYTYTYTVEDACGRTATCEQVFTIENAAPIITCPADTVVACGIDIIPGTADFQTSCELGTSLEVTGPVIEGEPDCPGTTYTYTFTGTDECGREASCERVFTIENDPPVIICAENVIVSCASEISVTIPSFDTDCELGGSVSVSDPVVDGTPNCEGTTYTYTFTGMDDCGRVAICDQVFTVMNSEPPTIECPVDATVFCAGDIVVGTEDIVFTTGCDVDGTVEVSEPMIEGEPDCPGTTYTYTYTVEDVCGGTATCEQVFTIANVPPTISCPIGATVACAADIVVDASNIFFATSCELEGTVTVDGPIIEGEPDCPGTTYTYTYTVEDACGRTLSCDQVFTIENEAPSITCPADEVVTCSADISVDASNAVFTTSCALGANVSLSGPIISGTEDCPGTTYTYTYTVEDACGRIANCDQVFTIENEAPTIICPADEVVACSADISVDASNAIFTVSCDLDTDVSVNGPVINGTEDCPSTTYTYTYTIEDACGRTASCDQVFTIENAAPTITCPADTIVTCAADIVPGTADFEASCELGASLEVTGPMIEGEPDCPGTTYTYTFTVTDECGREAACERVFTIQNDEPVITCPEDMIVSCAAEIAVAIPIFETSCGLGGSVSVNGPVVDGTHNCEGTTYTYTFIGTDACDRIASCEQVFTIVNDPPTITCPPGETVFCSADIEVDPANAVFTTSCDVDGTVSISEPMIEGEPDCPGTTYTYTYTVEDACGRTASCEQVFTISNSPPIISCPLGATVACAADIAVDTSNIFFVTSCEVEGTVSVSEPVIEGEPDCPGTTYTYTYTVEDACGRTLSCDQVFTIENEAPIITCPVDTVVTCSTDILVDVSNAIFTTSCNLGADVSLSGPVIDGTEDCQGTTYTYTYTVEDACGRIASCDQIFTIENEAPTITCPADSVVTCATDIVVDASNAIFTTSCGLDATVSLSGPVIDGIEDCSGTTYTYTYTVEDACGRTASCDQIFTIENTAPTITCPADTIVTCAADIIPGTAEFETSCELGGIISRSGPIITGEPDCPGTTYTYIFAFADQCGREVTCEQVFTIQNDEPVITCPEDVTISCDSEIIAAIPVFETSCGLGGEVAIEGPVVDGIPNCEGTTYTYTFIGTDACGRTASCNQVFTISNEVPIITCPAGVTVFCSADIVVDAADAVFTTSCDIEGTVSISEPVIEGEPDCSGTTYTYTYTVEDVCGRTASCEQVFTIANTSPIISCPLGATVACSADIVIDTANIVFITSCDVEGTVSVSGPTIEGEPDCPGTTYAYVYTAEDVCGRTISCEQVFTIENEAPTITCPADTIVACATDIVLDTANVIFTTGCDLGANVSLSGPVINGTEDCPGTTYIYTYTVEDVCGRAVSCEQVFTIENEVPTITCPADTIVACSADIIVAAENAAFMASCDVETNISLSGPVIEGTADCPGTTYTYTYTVEDICGRTASCDQVFTIENAAPTITCPADTIVACAADIIPGTADFETSCELGASLELTGPVIEGEPDCPGTTYTYTFTVTDECGRETSCERVFTIESEAPEIICSEDKIVTCAADILVEIPILNTACGLGGDVTVSGPVIDGIPDCEGTTYTYTFTGTDDCGRTIDCNQVFTISNTISISCPADAVVTCSADIVADTSNVSFITSCDLEGSVSVSEPVIEGEPDCPGTTYTYTYTVEDVCGRTASCEQVFTINNTPPVVSCPLSAVVACAADIVVDSSSVSFATSCGVDGTVSVDGPLVEGEPDCPGSTYTYTYTVEDVCGRTLSCNQVFTIENEGPTITCPTDTVTVACAADIVPDTMNVAFTTSCGLDGAVSMSEPIIDGIADCAGTSYTFTYTVEDSCGRMASCDQVFTIENDPPTISCPADTMVICAADIVLDTANVVFTTSCELDGIISVSEPEIIGEPDCPGSTYIYTYTVEDACGRTTSCEQVFTIDDSELTISCPADTIVFCEAEIAIDTLGASFTSSCGVDGTVTVDSLILEGIPNCSGTTYTYVYSVEDVCGRIASCEQIFTIENDPPAIIECPTDTRVIAAADIVTDTALVVFTTSCDLEATVSVSEPIIEGEPDTPGAIYTYTYTVEDVCGRTATCEQIFTIANEAVTIVSCPTDTTATCSADIVPDIDAVVFVPNCNDEATITVEGPVLEGEPDCSGTTYTYTFVVADICGTSTCDQVFTLINDGPTITTCPEGYSVVCATDIELGTPEFTTNCEVEGTLNVTGPVIEGEPNTNGSTYTYTHIITDACGRADSCQQVFTIVNECYTIDFDFDDAGNALAPGTEISDQYEDFTVTTENFPECARLFDTGNPSGNNFALGTPNEQYGGPGIGVGGASNTEFQGNALIVSQNCNNLNEITGQLIFTFDCGVTIKTVDLLDMSCPEGEIELYDINGNQIGFLPIPEYGENSFNEFEVNRSGVYTMIVDLDCGGGVTGFTYCKDNTPGANCGEVPSLCYDYTVDHGECGAAWQEGDLSGTVELDNETIDITIIDPDNILDNTQTDGTGLLVRSDPNDVDDEVIIYYDLSKSSEYVAFDIIDIDFKNTNTGQQEQVCIYGTLGNNPTQIFPAITSLEGSVMVDGNCAIGGASSADSGDDESVFVEFTECIDKITIIYGAGPNSPTPDPDNSKIVIGGAVFDVEQCKEGCECPEDDDNDGVCNDEDICPGGDDLIDNNGDGIPDDCEVQCNEYMLDFRAPGYNWSGHGEVESYTVGNQTFDVLITDGDNIIENAYDYGAGLAIVTDADDADEEYVITYNLSQVANGVTFDIIDLDFTEGLIQETVCIYATLGDDPTQILPTITPLNGSVAVDGNCAIAMVNSAESGQSENILVEFTECINEITIVYGTAPDASVEDPIVGNITIGRNYGFVTEVCEEGCPELREEESTNAQINLYPNPVYGSDNVTIEIETETRGDAQIVLVDALGRIISNENIQLMNNFTRHEISVDALSAGIYFVQLQTEEWRTDGLKFIVVKP